MLKNIYSKIVLIIICGLAMGSQVYAQQGGSDFEVSPTSINFGTVDIFDRIFRDVTIRNNSQETLNFTGQMTNITGNGNFVFNSANQGSIAAGQSATIQVVYLANGFGEASATLLITTNLGNASVTMSGNAVVRPPLIQPASVDFGAVNVGGVAVRTLTLFRSASGFAPDGGFMVTGLQINGEASGFFLVGPAIPITVSGMAYRIDVGFRPTSQGQATGSLVISTTTFGVAQTSTVQLSGEGTVEPQPGLEVLPNPVDFGTAIVDQSITRTITIRNSGNMTLTLQSFNFSSDTPFAFFGEIPSNRTLEPGGSVTANLFFNTGRIGTITGFLTITAAAGQSTISVTATLTGRTVDRDPFQAQPNPVDFGTIAAGSIATRTTTLTNTHPNPLFGFIIRQVVLSPSDAPFVVTSQVLNQTLVGGQSIPVVIDFRPQLPGIYNATLTITDSGDKQTVINLTGQATVPNPPVGLDVSPRSIDFGSVDLNVTSTRVVTLRNTGSEPITIADVTSSGATGTIFVASQPGMTTIPPNMSTTFEVGFRPASVGDFNATVIIRLNNGSQVTISVVGSGNAGTPRLEVVPTSIDFGEVAVNSTESRSFTVKNTGTGFLTLQSLAIVEGGATFSFSPQTPPVTNVTLGNNGAYQFFINFTPTAEGVFTGSIMVNTSEGNVTVRLRGRSTLTTTKPPRLVVTPMALEFNNVNIGEVATRSLTLRNVGENPLTFSTLSITAGLDSGFFFSTQPTLTTLNAGQSFTLNVSFRPKTANQVTGSILIESDGGSFTITLRGRGSVTGQPKIEVTPASIDFGNVSAGATVRRTVTIRNTQGGQLSFSLLMNQTNLNSGFFLISQPTNNLLGAGESTTFEIGFRATATGITTGSLDILSSGNNTTINMRANVTTGSLLELGTTSIDFNSVNIGEMVTRAIILRNTGGGQISLSILLIDDGGNFAFSNPDTTTLDAGQRFSFNVGFRPKAVGDVKGLLAIQSNGGDFVILLRGQGNAVGKPTLEVLPGSIDFGTVNFGEGSVRQVNIRNTGQGDLTFSATMNGDTGFSLSQLASTTLAAGQSASFDVSFRPITGNVEVFTGTLVISSNGGTATIALQGRANKATGRLELSSTSLDFGQVLTGESRTLNVTIRNTGDASAGAIDITDLAARTIEGANRFEIIGRPSAPIPPGGSAELQIRFSPTDIDSLSGSIGQIAISTSTGQTANLEVKGRGFVRLAFGNKNTIQLTEGRVLSVPITLQGQLPASGLTVRLAPRFEGSLLDTVLNQNIQRMLGAEEGLTASLIFNKSDEQKILSLKLTDLEIGPTATFTIGLAANSNQSVDLEPLTIRLKPNASPDILRTFNCNGCLTEFTQEGDRLVLQFAFFDRNRDVNRLIVRLQNESGEIINLPAITVETNPQLAIRKQGGVVRLQLGNVSNFGQITTISIQLQDAAGNSSTAILPDSAGTEQQQLKGVELKLKQDELPRIELIEVK
jgi:large repetitive protein